MNASGLRAGASRATAEVLTMLQMDRPCLLNAKNDSGCTMFRNDRQSLVIAKGSRRQLALCSNSHNLYGERVVLVPEKSCLAVLDAKL